MKRLRKFEDFNKQIGRVLLTGVSGSGKSTIISKLDELGYDVVEEPARRLIKKLKKDDPNKLPWNNRYEFQKLVEETNLLDFKYNDNSFFDRGIIDEVVYRNYYGLDIPKYLDDRCKIFKYDKVFLFPPFKEIYKKDNERIETFKKSSELYPFFLKILNHYKYKYYIVPKDTIENRIEYILKRL